MSDDLAFGPDRGLRELWLFALHVPENEVDEWEPPRPGSPYRDWPLVEALGAGPIAPAHVNVFPADDLGRYGLRKFLTDALGMDPDQVEADAAKIDQVHGTGVIVHDKALLERPGRFEPQKPPLRFVGHYTQPQHLAPARPRPARESTEGHIEGPAGPTSAPAGLRRGLVITLAVLAVLALAVVALV